MSEVKTNKISSLASNNDITIDPDGTGNTIIASGEVGVGTTTPATYTDYVSGSNAPSVVVAGSQPSYVLADTDISGNDGTLGITKSGEDTIINNLGAGSIKFFNNGGEKLTIDSDGDLGIGGTPGNIRFKISNTENKITQFLHASNASYTDQVLEIETVKAGASDFNFMLVRSNNGGDTEFKVRGDGQVSADGSFSGGGADYAEYFEWSDGNSSNEDRRGYSVVLDGTKIRKATSDDAAASIIGIVSTRPVVVGDTAWNHWAGRWVRDDYGDVVRESDGTKKQATDYDASRTYVPRENRVEWDAIGLMGKLRIRKGQPTGDRWLKLRVISSDVEEWLVR